MGEPPHQFPRHAAAHHGFVRYGHLRDSVTVTEKYLETGGRIGISKKFEHEKKSDGWPMSKH